MSDQSLDNVVTNGMDFKHLETTKDIIISIKNEHGYHHYPDATHTWTAKVSDGTNYVGDYAVKVNITNLIVDSEDFTKLPVGSYQLEVWEEWIDPDGTQQRSIYPSPSQKIPFNIYANVTDQAEKEIKRIGFQDVVDQAVMNVGMNYVFKVNTIEPDQTATVAQSAADGKNYVTFSIPRGAKGDPGPVGPQGPVGPVGPQGSHGYNFWVMKTTAGGNVSGRDITDLYNASNTNLPMVGDSVLQPDGNVYRVTGVSDTDNSSNGGGSFNLGSALFSIKDANSVVRHAPTAWSLDRSTTPWTIWFDNGSGIQFPSYATTSTIYGYGFTASTSLTRFVAYPLVENIISASRGSITLDYLANNMFGEADYWAPNTKVINPINTDSNLYDWSNTYFNDRSRQAGTEGQINYRQHTIFRVFYELGIWSIDDIKPFGLVKKS